MWSGSHCAPTTTLEHSWPTNPLRVRHDRDHCPTALSTQRDGTGDVPRIVHDRKQKAPAERCCGAFDRGFRIKSFWSMFKRGYVGAFHKISEKHHDRYVTELSGRHNVREPNTIDQMADIVTGMKGKSLRYADPISDNGLASGARTT